MRRKPLSLLNGVFVVAQDVYKTTTTISSWEIEAGHIALDIQKTVNDEI